MSKSAVWILVVVVLIVLGTSLLLLRDNADLAIEGTDNLDGPEEIIDLDDTGQFMFDDEDTLLENDDPFSEVDSPSVPDGVLPAAPEATVAATSPTTKEFTLTGGNFAFSSSQIHVNQGDTVRINFSSTDGLHDWVVDEFNAATARVNTGEAASVEFVATRAGTFEYYCSVGNHREQGMVGQLIVE